MIAVPNSPIPEFPYLDPARLWLLSDAASIAGRSQSVVVVGGWCSVLNNHRQDGLQHPGTKDVDLLFENGATPGDLASVVNDLMAAGYVLSAKHGFQLVRIIRVGNDELAFSVDLLHPSPKTVDSVGEMFSKHVDLAIEQRPGVHGDTFAVSIGTPVLEAVFHYNLIVEHLVPGAAAPIRFLNDAGLIVSKASSVSLSKRQRDSYDLFLALKQPLTTLAETEEQLRIATGRTTASGAGPSPVSGGGDPNAPSRSVRTALGKLRHWLLEEGGANLFDARVREQALLLDKRDTHTRPSRLHESAVGDDATELVSLLDRVLTG